MIINISGEINVDCFDKLIRCYNELKEKDTLDIYFNTEGGYVDYAEAILDIINEHSDKTSLIGYGCLYSAGFDIFFRSTCEKTILRGTVGMVHISTVESDNLRTIKEGRADEEMMYYKKWAKKDKESRLIMYEILGLSSSELLKMKTGKDVYIHFDRLIELLKHKHGEHL